MPEAQSYHPQEVREIQALRQRQQEASLKVEEELEGLVLGMASARADLEKSLQDFVQSCDRLLQASRKFAAEPFALRYRTYATMQVRLAGAVNQVLKRSETGARILQASKRASEEQARSEEVERVRKEIRASQKRVERSLLPAHDDFESLYGSDFNVEDLI